MSYQLHIPARSIRATLAGASVLALAMALPAAARADDYTDLLDVLRAKGSLTKSEYSTLLAKHTHHGRRARKDAAQEETTTTDDTQAASAQQAAAAAAASASQAQAAATSAEMAMKDPLVVHTSPYVPGKGVTLQAGPVAINFSGFVNGFYTYNTPNTGDPVAGGLSSGGPHGFDSSSVRNGLLPAALITKLSTTQAGIDLAVVFGMYPGLNSASVGALNANNGGESVALGTAGVDFRQIYVTAGSDQFGTVKVGRDIGLFGSDAILNDATLLSVGSTGNNSAPSNTSLGRIGIGYVYTDFMPQITYSSPEKEPLRVSLGIFQPLDEFSFSGLSASNTQHTSPMFQGKITYDMGTDIKTHLWADFLVQHENDILTEEDTTKDITALAGDVGGKIDVGPAEGVAYYYRGSGLGTTGIFFDGVAQNGNKRNSEGYYVQGAYKFTPKFKLVGSYGVSDLYYANGEVDPLLVRRNESEVGAVYYTLTDWMTLVGEYAHTTAKSHSEGSASDNTISLGTIVFF